MSNTGKTNKHSKVELDLTLELVIEMIVKGQSRTDILRYFTENENIEKRRSVSSVDKYIKRAALEIKKRFSADKEKVKPTAIARYMDLYKKNYAIQDYRECRQVQDSLNKLVGLNEPEKISLEVYDLTLKLD